MDENKEKKPKRIVTFGNFSWVHWITVSFFLIGGVAAIIIPNVLYEKWLLSSIICGSVFVVIGVICVCDHLVFVHRMKEWRKKHDKKFSIKE